MLKKQRTDGAWITVLLAAVILLLTLFVAVPNAGKLSEMMVCFSTYMLPPTVRLVRAPEQEETSDQEQTQPKAAQDDQIPADILQMQTDFSPTGTPAGTVTERLYGEKSATDLVGNIAIKNGTSALHPDFAALLAQPPVFAAERENEPLVLVYHTHTTESYQRADTGAYYTDGVTRSEDPAVNMVRVGDALCAALEENGIVCVHDTEIYDKTYTGAYACSRVNVQKTLAQYPSIKIALDVHRDAIFDSSSVAVKPTAEIGGRKVAQIMILTGAQEGSVTDFPDWQENLKFALNLHQKAESLYPGLMRPLYFCPRRYNMDLVPCGLLLEVGSDANTLEEAYLAARFLGRALAAVIHENTTEK